MAEDHNKSLTGGDGFARLQADILAGDPSFLDAIFDLAVEYVTHSRDDAALHASTMAELNNLSTLADLPAHDVISRMEKLYLSAQDTSGLPADEPLWDKSAKLQALLSARDASFSNEYFRNLIDRDVNYKSLTWEELKTHYVATENRLKLPSFPGGGPSVATTPAAKPATSTPPATGEAAFCHIHGPMVGGHSTDGCAMSKWIDRDACDLLRAADICILHVLGRCKRVGTCPKKHKTARELIEHNYHLPLVKGSPYLEHPTVVCSPIVSSPTDAGDESASDDELFWPTPTTTAPCRPKSAICSPIVVPPSAFTPLLTVPSGIFNRGAELLPGPQPCA